MAYAFVLDVKILALKIILRELQFWISHGSMQYT